MADNRQIAAAWGEQQQHTQRLFLVVHGPQLTRNRVKPLRSAVYIDRVAAKTSFQIQRVSYNACLLGDAVKYRKNQPECTCVQRLSTDLSTATVDRFRLIGISDVLDKLAQSRRKAKWATP